MKPVSNNKASVLLTTLLTITVLTMICATSLYVTSQNANAGTQTASWQQSLAGAEAAMDQAMNALNKSDWTGWHTVADLTCGSADCLPATKPTDVSQPAVSAPNLHYYNYLVPNTLAVSPPGSGVIDESGKTLSSWVTVDTAGLPLDQYGFQAYRIRATGVVSVPGPRRVSNRRFDSDLRKISLIFDRFSGTAVSTPQAVRRIELIAMPISNSTFPRAITMQNWISMTGSNSIIDSFDSSNPFKSNNGQYDPAKRQSHGDVALVNSAKNNNVSNLNGNSVYGSLKYSGPAVKKTTGVLGTVSTPFNTTLPLASDPTATFVNYTSGVNNQTVTAGAQGNPTRLKIVGNFALQQDFNINAPQGSSESYIEIWVTGNYNTTGNGLVVQAPGVHVTWYVDGNISTAGNAYNNQSGYAANVSFMAVGDGSITISGNGNFIGTFYGPLRDVAFTGNGALMGAVIGNNITISSNASIHYDEALATTGSATLSNYAYASWFEDNSDPARNATF